MTECKHYHPNSRTYIIKPKFALGVNNGENLRVKFPEKQDVWYNNNENRILWELNVSLLWGLNTPSLPPPP